MSSREGYRGPGRRKVVGRDGYVHLHEGVSMSLWSSIRRCFRDAKVTEFYVRIRRAASQCVPKRWCALCVSARQFVGYSGLGEEMTTPRWTERDPGRDDLQ